MITNKPLMIIQSPYSTRSGYGDFSRDIITHLIRINKYDIKLISTPWGMTPMNALDADNPAHEEMLKRTIVPPFNLSKPPEIFVHITVPNEFQKLGKYNIGITAGIETTLCSVPWLEGCNRMDCVWTISEHSKRVLESTLAEIKNPQGQIIKSVKLEVPCEVLHNCFHDVFNTPEESKNLDEQLLAVKEKFNFLFVGHWLQGETGHDRKNIGNLVKIFAETFKGVTYSKRPGLILKSSGATFSILDRERIIENIESIKQTVGPNCPNIYLIHGELTEQEMSALYHHSKIKCHISLTKGEGFGRPLLEATLSGKPVIASGWSGHLDFLDKEKAILVDGSLQQVHPSSVMENIIVPESSWFSADPNHAAAAMMAVFENYSHYKKLAESLVPDIEQNFSDDAIFDKTKTLVEKYIPTFATEVVNLKMPKLKKLNKISLEPSVTEDKDASLAGT